MAAQGGLPRLSTASVHRVRSILTYRHPARLRQERIGSAGSARRRESAGDINENPFLAVNA